MIISHAQYHILYDLQVPHERIFKSKGLQTAIELFQITAYTI